MLFTQIASSVMENIILDNENTDLLNRKTQINTICKRYNLSKESRKYVNLLDIGIYSDVLLEELEVIKMLPN